MKKCQALYFIYIPSNNILACSVLFLNIVKVILMRKLVSKGLSS